MRIPEKVLVTGATGFVGRHAVAALRGAGFDLLCASRDPERARARDSSLEWVRVDVEDPTTIGPALARCDALLHLVHQMDGKPGYPAREKAAAEALRDAADEHNLRRIVFLGGPDPGPEGSKHLKSRLASGHALRAGTTSAIELRAAMVIGHGSASWTMTRDLAKRLPAMVLPKWAANHSWPIGIADVVVGIAAALALETDESRAYDLPGAERLSHREMLERAASALGNRPSMLPVPVLSPRLSSYWIALITGVDLHMAKELVEGVTIDLDPTAGSFWDAVEHSPQSVDEAIRAALAEQAGDGIDGGAIVARIRSLLG